MIFVTVGTQLPFDRMVKTVDAWAATAGVEVVAQIGPTPYACRSMRCCDFMATAEFDAHFQRAEWIIAHAGMGSILSALSFGKRLVIMPRRAAYREHRNDHQLATAKRFAGVPGVHVAWDEHELQAMLPMLTALTAGGQTPISPYAAPAFLDKLAHLVDD
jgi:UDP-N-acetylglucosamine transferase subunit ALG13